MASTFTPNLGFEEPARGDDVGVWDAPWNSNSTLLDLVTGGIATISLNNSNVILAASQFRCKTIIFNSTLTAGVQITFPSTFIKSYEVQNICTGSSAFTVTLITTTPATPIIAAPPGVAININNDGAGNLRYRNFGHIGEYWDYGGSSVPGWISACTTPLPYLNCDGTSFSSATYPQLAALLGTTTLPDSRGRIRAALNQTTGRLNSTVSGVDGNTRFAGGGSELMQQHNHAITDPGHTHGHNAAQENSGANNQSGAANVIIEAAATVSPAATGVTINNNGAGTSQNMPPAYVGGLTLIRAG